MRPPPRGPLPIVRIAVGIVVVLAVVAWLTDRDRITSGLALTYTCPEPVAAEDSRIMLARLPIELPATVEVVDQRHVRVRVENDARSLAIARSLGRACALDVRVADGSHLRIGPLDIDELFVDRASARVSDAGVVLVARFNGTGARALERAHEASAGAPFAVTLDDDVLPAHFDGGSGSLEMLFSPNAADLPVAETIAAALPISRPTCSHWTIEHEEPF